MTYEQYEQEVQRHLTEKRFYHSQCVAQEAARLAQQYGADVEKARLAGILHDIMKDTPPEEQLKILQDSGIILTKTQRHNRKLWHALAGAAYLQQTLQVKDGDIVEAVRCHTSGKKDMSLLEGAVCGGLHLRRPGVPRGGADASGRLQEPGRGHCGRRPLHRAGADGTAAAGGGGIRGGVQRRTFDFRRQRGVSPRL